MELNNATTKVYEFYQSLVDVNSSAKTDEEKVAECLKIFEGFNPDAEVYAPLRSVLSYINSVSREHVGWFFARNNMPHLTLLCDHMPPIRTAIGLSSKYMIKYDPIMNKWLITPTTVVNALKRPNSGRRGGRGRGGHRNTYPRGNRTDDVEEFYDGPEEEIF